jgi:hypothetical protein
MAVQALCTPVTQKHRHGSMHLAHIYYYTYLIDNFSQGARNMCLNNGVLPSWQGEGKGEQGEGKPRPYM